MKNLVILIGNVGQDPEIKNTGDKREVATFSLATTESWKDKNTGEKKDKTEWHRIVIFNPVLINLCRNFVKKGSKLMVEGKIKTRKYQNENESTERSITEIILDFDAKILLLDNKPTAEPAKSFHEPEQEENFDEVPF
jgi:single-strand DNA-binding protein